MTGTVRRPCAVRVAVGPAAAGSSARLTKSGSSPTAEGVAPQRRGGSRDEDRTRAASLGRSETQVGRRGLVEEAHRAASSQQGPKTCLRPNDALRSATCQSSRHEAGAQ